ncbi:IS30 family transposase [Streptomyces triticisoli]|uniref:IS30 family transposase n=1 Tax=Streptomyces triticisoli TaxID=2182797 RepID=UPI001E40739F|nr:IS30 family transposase [Streptomyces triticisoli]
MSTSSSRRPLSLSTSSSRRPLSLLEREEISRGLAEGLEQKQIAERIGRCPSIVSREIRRHGGRERYRAARANSVAAQTRRRPKARKLDRLPELRREVLARLGQGHSPDQIAGRLRRERGGGDPDQVISHEAVYTWIYALPKGELARHGVQLRSGRTSRKPRGRATTPGARIIGMRSIDDRPAEAAGRAVPGHWEGDLIIGRNGKTALGTLVERTSRFFLPVPLPGGKNATSVCDALITTVTDVPETLRRSLTWDQGTEMAQHQRLSLATDLDVYFAHPHSPWERGTNENTNRLLREYFPKGTDITTDPAYLQAVAGELNSRPRRILDYRTPAEVFTELLTSSIASTG